MKLIGDNFIIRNYINEDAEYLTQYANNSKIWINLRDGFPHPYTLEDANHFISLVNLADPVTNYGIIINDICVGAIGFEPGQNVFRKTAEVGYWLGEEFWGRGIMTKAVKIFTDFMFESFDIERIQASVFDWNPASAKVLEKAGFTFEARLRKHIIKNGMLGDELIYAKLKNN